MRFLQLISFALLTLLPALIQAQPMVDLGPADTVLCGGSLMLDAANPGATYLWSTNATTQSITVSSSDTIWVEVSDMSGTSRDTIVVHIVSPPPTPALTDTTLCSPTELVLQTSSLCDYVFWYRDLAGTDLIGFGDSLILPPPANDTSFYAQCWNTSSLVGQVGYDTIVGVSSFRKNDFRGLIFDVVDTIILESVDVFSTGAGSSDLTILLTDASGTVLDSTRFIGT
ncbi:MAG: hypothetical protein AAF206_21890, partial [Bacteroidota bacterium]